MNLYSVLFAAMLLLAVSLQLHLARRQRRHIETHRDQVPKQFAGHVTLAEHRKAADYSLAKLQLEKVSLLTGALVLLVWLFGGMAEIVLAAWSGAVSSPLLAGTGAILSILLINALLFMPIDLYRVFGIEETFGFNRSGLGRFAADQLLHMLLAVTLGGTLAMVFLWLMTHGGPLWWLMAWAVWMLFMVFLAWAFPTVIAPLFNRFTPLAEGELRQRIQKLLARCGFRDGGILVMDGSRRSGHGNAYFSGLGRKKRIVFFDTLIEALATDELEAVLAHELGHFRRRHVIKQLGVTAVLALAVLAGIGWLAEQPALYTGLGMLQSDAAALILVVLAGPVFLVIVQPGLAYISRRYEFEADDFAVGMTGAKPLISALVKLYRDNARTLTPDPAYSAFHDTHPPAPVRIAHISSRIATSV